ncbi:hypothetical protein [Rhizobium cremeum]|uniref:hypothetical protein n=1 Tax=Rhizobium cremeum TaxID=2813827 RepID=UPI0039E02242
MLLNGQIPHDLEAYVQSQAVSFDDVMQVERALPLTVVEAYAVEDMIASLWLKRGKRTFLSSFALEFFPHSPDERREYLGLALAGGWVPVYSADARVEFRIVKTFQGTGFFGREKAFYRLYRSMSSGRFAFISEHKSMSGAMQRLNAELYG